MLNIYNKTNFIKLYIDFIGKSYKEKNYNIHLLNSQSLLNLWLSKDKYNQQKYKELD